MAEVEARAEIEIKIGAISVRVSGDSGFVEKNIDKMLQEALSKNPAIVEVATTDSASLVGLRNNVASEANKYVSAGLYSVDSEDGKIHIHSQVPGNAKSQRMKNTGLILAYAAESNEPISSSSIREACREQGCLDEKNFASVFKKDIEDFICKDSGKSWELKLTLKGKKLAQGLLDGMLGE